MSIARLTQVVVLRRTRGSIVIIITNVKGYHFIRVTFFVVVTKLLHNKTRNIRKM